MSRELQKLRSQIDAIDRAILSALAKRKKFERAVGTYKRKHGMKVLDRKRRAIVLKSRVAHGKAQGLPPALVRKLFALVHTHSLSVQKKTKI